ncbi:MAG: SDR family NAD(P)-dependent oxidoreductase [Alphaproteobacteria bacterium]
MEINGTAALVTGGASGLGLATARLLAGRGAVVTLLDLPGDRLDQAAESLGCQAAACDVTDSEQAAKAVRSARDASGPARMLVNCAGIAPAGRIVGRSGPLPLEQFEQVIRVNLIGTFNLLRLAAADMAETEPNDDGERGVIVNTASVAAFDGQIGQAAYAASKGGVAALTLPAARELARFGIRVVTIAPGIFETAMLKGLTEDIQKSLGASVPFPQRLGRPSEYAELVRAIVENPMLNGETIRLDGALRMAPK